MGPPGPLTEKLWAVADRLKAAVPRNARQRALAGTNEWDIGDTPEGGEPARDASAPGFSLRICTLGSVREAFQYRVRYQSERPFGSGAPAPDPKGRSDWYLTRYWTLWTDRVFQAVGQRRVVRRGKSRVAPPILAVDQ